MHSVSLRTERDDGPTPRPAGLRSGTKLGTLPLLFLTLLSCLLITAGLLQAAPFRKKIAFTQPDGTRLELWGEGDEFHAVFETLDGYTVLFDTGKRAYYYAQLAPDGSDLILSNLQVGRDQPATLGLRPHLRANVEMTRLRARERHRAWDQVMQVAQRWQALKQHQRGEPAGFAPDGAVMAPPTDPTLGTKIGLTLLIDFSDAPATISQSAIADFCNADSYTGYGNNGSVKQYFLDNSNGLLTYQNVVTIYVRMAQPKSYYNDTSKDCGDQGNLLIKDALAILKSRPDYNSVILPTFDSLTVDSSGWVLAFNVLYAGSDSGVWTKGLWPHSYALVQSGHYSPVALGNSKSACYYQITDIGSELKLGTFCHENGHMLCGYPDLYDYGYDSQGGAGAFCLMDAGGNGSNPVQICAYLKAASGWATITDLDVSSNLAASLSSSGPDFNHFYRFSKPGAETEYYLLENRQKAGRDANLPASGIAIWHIDELGDRDNQSLIPNAAHANYEVTLVQADNLWHFENNANVGDSNDLYYSGNSASGYQNQFTDTSSPNAHWWDGLASGILFRSFSASSSLMTFTMGTGDLPAPILNSEPASTPGTQNTVAWQAGATPLPALGAIRRPIPTTRPALRTTSPTTQTRTGPLLAPQVVLTQAFEGDPTDTGWMTYGAPTWGVTSASYHAGGHSAWCAGSSGGNPAQGYPANMGAWMIYGPVNLAGASSAQLKFWFRNQTDAAHAYLRYMASTDGSTFNGPSAAVANDWTSQSYSLNSFCGHPQVWIAFFFFSDSQAGTGAGAFVDDLTLEMQPLNADLQVPEVSWPTGSPTEAGSVQVRARIFNAGPDAAGPSHAALYLSTDNDANVFNDFYVGDVAVGALANGASQWAQWDFTLPNLGSGSYPLWLLCVADRSNEVVETDENNLVKSPTPLSVSDPPLQFYAECASNPSFTLPSNSGWMAQTQWTFPNLVPGQTYWFRVKARQGARQSGWSNVASSQQVASENQAPALVCPSDLSAPKQTSQAIAGLQVSDPDAGAGQLTLSLSVAHGTLTVSQTVGGGLAAPQITGNGTPALTATAPLAAINATLAAPAGLLYTGGLNFVGQDELLINVDDHGNTGAGGAKSAQCSVAISVNGTPYDAWLITRFPQSDWTDAGKETTVWGASADPDHDGRSNLMEYALGLNPASGGDAGLGIQSHVQVSSGLPHLALIFKRRMNDPSLGYVMEVSADQTGWNSGSEFVNELSATRLDSEFEEVTCLDLTPLSAGAPRFARLRIIRP